MRMYAPCVGLGRAGATTCVPCAGASRECVCPGLWPSSPYCGTYGTCSCSATQVFLTDLDSAAEENARGSSGGGTELACAQGARWRSPPAAAATIVPLAHCWWAGRHWSSRRPAAGAAFPQQLRLSDSLGFQGFTLGS